jgi:hypothetical protein
MSHNRCKLKLIIGWLLATLLWLVVPGSNAIAQAAPSQQPATEMRVHLGNEANELRFVPDRLTFEAGKRYKLILDNPSA